MLYDDILAPFYRNAVMLCRHMTERISVWVLLHLPDAPHQWGGLVDLQLDEFAEIRRQSPSIVLLGGSSSDVYQLVHNNHSQLYGAISSSSSIDITLPLLE